MAVDLGRVGIHSHQAALLPGAKVHEAVAEIEELGYGAIWIPEGLAFKEIFSISAMVLAWTSRIVVATGIANIWARDAMAMDSGARTLGEAFPGRFVLGIGTSHSKDIATRGHIYDRKPLSAMRAYLDGMDAAQFRGPDLEEPVPRVLAAMGPKMLALAAERTWGTHTSVVPVEHTAFAREVIGPDALIAPLQRVVFDTDADSARERARAELGTYLRLENYRNNLLRLGFREEDLEDGGTDEVVDRLVAWGDADKIATRIREHLDAGANHVCIRPFPSWGPEFPIDELRELAPALLAL